MSQTNWDELFVILKEVCCVKRNIPLFWAFLFLYYNWGHNFHALRTTFSIMIDRWVRAAKDIPFSPHNPGYDELYSVYNMYILAGTIAAALLAIFGTFCLIRFMDFIFSYDSALPREARNLQRRVRREIKHLDNQGRILTTLENDQDAKDKAVLIIKRMEDIILRYEQRAARLSPDTPRPEKLSEREETFLDLFSDLETAKQEEKQKTNQNKIKFRPKF